MLFLQRVECAHRSFSVERFGEFPPTNAGKEMASPSPPSTFFSFPRTLLPNVYVCVCVRALKTEPPSIRSQPLNTEKGGKGGGSAKSREKRKKSTLFLLPVVSHTCKASAFSSSKSHHQRPVFHLCDMGKGFFCLGTFICLTGGSLFQFPK